MINPDKTLLYALADGDIQLSEAEDYVEYWRTHETDKTLPDFLGLTPEQIIEWNREGNDILWKFVVEAVLKDEMKIHDICGKVPDDIKNLALSLSHLGMRTCLVGGSVRDLLMGQEPHDYDLVAEADGAMSILDTCESLGYDLLPSPGMRFGTAVIDTGKHTVEVTAARKESGYSDGRHPDRVEFGGTIEEDLARRDFTINAMALELETETLIDPYHGREHLKDGTLAAVGDARMRIKEDPLRILRALRFSIRMDARIDQELASAIRENTPLLFTLSKERVTNELKKIFTCGKPVHDQFLAYSCVIAGICPEMISCMGFAQNSRYHRHDVYEHILAVTDACDTTGLSEHDTFLLKLSAFLHDIGKPAAYTEDEQGHGHFYGHPALSKTISWNFIREHLALTVEDRKMVLALVEHHDMPAPETEKQAMHLVTQYDDHFLDLWCRLREADRSDHIYPEKSRLPVPMERIRELLAGAREKQTAFSVKDLTIGGDDLMTEFSMEPGPELGKVLKSLFDRVSAGELPNEREALLAEVQAFVNQQEELER